MTSIHPSDFPGILSDSTRLNADEDVCAACARYLYEGEGLADQGYHFSGRLFWCKDCRPARDAALIEAAKRARARKVREAEVAQVVLPAVAKVGRVVQMMAGEDQYRSSLTVEASDGQRFTITIEAVKPDGEE